MARKTKGNKETSRTRAEYGKMQFVLNNLDDGQLEELDKMPFGQVDVVGFITNCVDNGIDVKISHDSYSGGYQAIASGGWKDYPSEGFGTSAFSKSGADDALFVLWYKVEIICEYNLSSASGREKRTRERG